LRVFGRLACSGPFGWCDFAEILSGAIGLLSLLSVYRALSRADVWEFSEFEEFSEESDDVGFSRASPLFNKAGVREDRTSKTPL
jgi:hypothetical protein